MKRKSIGLILTLLTALIGGATATAQSVGEWRLYSVFAGGIDKIIDAKNKMYYLSANRLYSYDKTTQESYTYGTDNVLNDSQISNIYYDADRNLVVLAYDTSNIDAINDNDGTVTNMSDISIANLTYTKTINDIAFGNGKMYVATDFGLVVYDEETMTVADSGIYGLKFEKVAVAGDYVVGYYNYGYYTAPVSSRLNTFDKFTKLKDTNTNMVMGIDAGLFEYQTSSKYLRFVSLTGDVTSYTDVTTVKDMQRVSSDLAYIISDTQILYVDVKTGEITERVTIPSDLQSQTIGFNNKALTSVWAGDASGIANYNISDGSATALLSKFKPEALSCTEVVFLTPSADNSRLYISNIGRTHYRGVVSVAGETVAFKTQQRMDVIVDGNIRDAALQNATATCYYGKLMQKNNKDTKLYGGAEKPAVDPQNPDRYFFPTNTEGIYVCKYNETTGEYEQEQIFNSDNMPIYVWWSISKGIFAGTYFDPEGNLWVGYRTGSSTNAYNYSPYLILPKDKLYGDLSTVTSDDWIQTKHLGKVIVEGTETRIAFCERSGYVFCFDDSWGRKINRYDTNKTYADVSDDSVFQLSNLKTQDGTSYSPQYWIDCVVDKNGWVWITSTDGVAYIPDETKVVEDGYQITRPKVARNDGTEYADYLLDSEQVNAVAVDPTNRKWFGTKNSGLYYVSEDGTTILDQFTTENSPLPTNDIESIYCDPNSNLVYIGTPLGMLTYRSTATSSASDYSNVYAYPNPVRPEYTGWITITGLMDNSLVKISDAAGNVLYQTRSEGGSVVWDGCNAAGERVKTGVYFVFASQSSDDSSSSSAVVTKIMVIK